MRSSCPDPIIGSWEVWRTSWAVFGQCIRWQAPHFSSQAGAIRVLYHETVQTVGGMSVTPVVQRSLILAAFPSRKRLLEKKNLLLPQAITPHWMKMVLSFPSSTSVSKKTGPTLDKSMFKQRSIYFYSLLKQLFCLWMKKTVGPDGESKIASEALKKLPQFFWGSDNANIVWKVWLRFRKTLVTESSGNAWKKKLFS